MKVIVKGKGNTVDLNRGDFVAQGGQGSIYNKGRLAYKIYDDPSRMIPEAKIRELASLHPSNIIKPEDVLLDSRAKPVGYTMKFITDTYALCQLFPKPFRTRQGLNPDNIVKLVRRMQETVNTIHNEKILIVDLNEMNFLVSKDFKEIYFIDVDSYQTHSFPANALMESVRDRHSNSFSVLTDWFSFGIVTYQMFRGIHPYKGKHPVYTTMDERMLHNISIHNPDVGYPQGAVLPMDVIPQTYQDWYRAVFDDGKRLPPPDDLIAVIHIVQPKIQTLAGKLFDIIPLTLFKRQALDNVINIYRSGATLIALTVDKAFNERTGHEVPVPAGTSVGFSPRKDIPVAAYVENKKLKVINLESGHQIACDLHADSVMDYQGNLYYKYGTNILQLNLMDMGTTITVAGSIITTVMEKATQLFSGCAIQNLLGTYYVNLFPEGKQTFQFKLPELAASHVVAAKYDNHVLMVAVSQEGKYNRYIFTFDEKFQSYQTRSVRDINYSGLNFVVLPQGICVSTNEDGTVDIFSTTAPQKVKNLNDDVVHDIQLLRDGSQVVFNQNQKFYQLKMK